MISPDGKTAYVSNEAGRIATADDFMEYSNGTPVVAEYPTGSLAKGTISVVNIAERSLRGHRGYQSRPPSDRHGPVGQEPARCQHL